MAEITEYVDVVTAAERCGMSKSGLLKAIERGTVEALKLGGRYYLHNREVTRYAKLTPAIGRKREGFAPR